MALSTAPTQKSLNQLLAFLNLYQKAKNQFISSVYSWETDNFRVPRPDWPHPFLTMFNPNIFDKYLIFVNLCQYPKNEAVSSICSGEIIDLKILQSDWLRVFWPISQDQDLSQIWDLGRKTINNVHFHFRTTNSVKINNQIFLQVWKTFFCPFLEFLGLNVFRKISGIVTYNRFLAPCQNSEKLMIQFQENVQMKGQKERWKNRCYSLEKPSGYC